MILSGYENHRSARLRMAGKCVEQGDHASVGGGYSESNGPGNGKSDDKSNQQTSQVRPAFPSLQQQEKKRINSDLHC
jgi:hypothetical protein